MKKIAAIAKKELLHIIRDPRSLAFAILMPLMMVLLYGYAIDMDLKHLKVGILDYDRSTASVDFVRRMTSGDFIVSAGHLNSREEVEIGFRRGLYHAVVIFPEGYSRKLQSDPNSPIQLIIDGSDGSTAAAVGNYLEAVTALLNYDQMRTIVGDRARPIETRPRVWFNPELESSHFIVPGLVAVVLMMICALLTSVAITREKETGTLEQVLTTPVKASQVIIGKVVPYLFISVIDAALILLVGLLVFHVRMVGSWWVLAGYSIIFVTIALSLGLLISTLARTQQVAMMYALLITVLPTIILSGFIFPVSSMPPALRGLAYIIPAYYYQTVIRGIMLKGVSWFPVEGGVMLLMAVLFIVAASKRFRMRIEQ